jgi:hypothetical protein
VVDVEYLDDASLLVDAVDDPVGAAPGTVASSQRAEQRLADPTRPQRQRCLTELENRRRHRFREPLGDSPARCGLEPDLVAIGVHAP